MPEPGRSPDRFAFADALRGVCALIVVLSHAMPTEVAWLPGHDPLNVVGRAGILVFLLISGFFLPLTCERDGSLPQFWIRRCFRLYPAYWLCIALSFVLYQSGLTVLSAPAHLRASDWLLNLTLTQEFFRRPSVLYVFWTLPLELVIYSTFSVLFALRLHHRSAWLVAGMLGVFAISGLARIAWGRPFGIIGGRFIYFAPLMGLLAYRYIQGSGGRAPMWCLGLGQAALLLASWLIDKALGREEPAADLTMLVTLFVWSLGYTAFFACLANRSRPMPSLLVRVGGTSYSLYLLHMLVISLLAPFGWPAWAHYPAVFAGTLAVAELSYRCVEAPSITQGRALERRWLPGRTKPRMSGPHLARAA